MGPVGMPPQTTTLFVLTVQTSDLIMLIMQSAELPPAPTMPMVWFFPNDTSDKHSSPVFILLSLLNCRRTSEVLALLITSVIRIGRNTPVPIMSVPVMTSVY